MRTKIIMRLAALAIIIASLGATLTPIHARPDEVLIKVYNISTGDLVGSRVLIMVWSEQDPSSIQYCWTDIEGRVLLENDGSWVVGTSYVIGESDYGMITVVGGFTLRGNCGSRAKVFVNPTI